MEKKLTTIQQRAITCLLQSNSVEEAAKKARISRSTIYKWQNNIHFKEILEKERKAVFDEGLNALKQATSKAVKTLFELLDSKDSNTRRLAAKDIISFAIKVVETRELEERVSELEEVLEKSRQRFS